MRSVQSLLPHPLHVQLHFSSSPSATAALKKTKYVRVHPLILLINRDTEHVELGNPVGNFCLSSCFPLSLGRGQQAHALRGCDGFGFAVQTLAQTQLSRSRLIRKHTPVVQVAESLLSAMSGPPRKQGEFFVHAPAVSSIRLAAMHRWPNPCSRHQMRILCTLPNHKLIPLRTLFVSTQASSAAEL